MSAFSNMTTAEKLQAERYLVDKAVGQLSHVSQALADRVLGVEENLGSNRDYRIGYASALVDTSIKDLSELAELIQILQGVRS